MKIHITILFLGFALFAHSQNKISGTITNAQNQPLFGVDIYIEELYKGTSTNKDGYYEINNLPNTPIKIKASFLGFKTQIKTINLQKKETILNFILEDAIFRMDEIIIATPFNKLQSENVIKVEKATLAQLIKRGATTLINGISTIPGVSQVSTGQGIGKPVIRGLRGNRVLVYAQGIRLENQQFGDEHGLGINEYSVESVEVIKGPASLLYGSDALGGVLYFAPERFAKNNTLNVRINQKYFSNTQGNQTSIGIKKTFRDWKFLVSGAHNLHKDYKIYNGKRVTNTRYNETIFNAGIAFNSNNTSNVLRVNLNETSVGIPEHISIQNTHKTPLMPYQKLSNKMVSFKNILFLPKSKITSIFGYTHNSRKEFEDHEDDKEIEQDDSLHEQT